MIDYNIENEIVKSGPIFDAVGEYYTGTWEEGNNIYPLKDVGTHHMTRTAAMFFINLGFSRNDNRLIDKVLNYFKIPDNLSMKERIAYYQLLGNHKHE